MVTKLSRQQLEIYLLLKENHKQETGVSEMTQLEGLNIASYTERISELRKKGYNVMNVRKNYYILISEPEATLDDLRFIYTQAKIRGYTNLMQRCKLRGEQMAKRLKEPPKDYFGHQVKQALL